MLVCTVYYNTDTNRSNWEKLQMYENAHESIPQHTQKSQPAIEET